LLLFALLLVALLATACGMAPANNDVEATLAQEASQIIAEATAIRVTAEAETTRMAATMSAAEIYLDQRRAVNAALLATVRADLVPTAQVIANVFGGTPAAILRGERWFVKTGMTEAIQASNGCAIEPHQQFPTNTQEIYATFEAHNIESGTPFSATWMHEGQVVHQESFNLNNGSTFICLWFSITPDIVPFTPGTWSVQLFMDVFPLEGPMLFTIRD
jgi:hypothetical protein